MLKGSIECFSYLYILCPVLSCPVHFMFVFVFIFISFLKFFVVLFFYILSRILWFFQHTKKKEIIKSTLFSSLIVVVVILLFFQFSFHLIAKCLNFLYDVINVTQNRQMCFKHYFFKYFSF